MGIGRIGGFYQYQPIQPIKRVELETVREQDEIKKQQEQMIPEVAQDTQVTPDTRSQMADLENISFNFNAGDTYDYIMPYLSGIASYDNGGAKPHLDKVLEYFGGEKFYAETTFISYDHTRFHGINVIEALRLAFGYYFESMVYDVQRYNNTYAYKDAMQMVGRE